MGQLVIAMTVLQARHDDFVASFVRAMALRLFGEVFRDLPLRFRCQDAAEGMGKRVVAVLAPLDIRFGILVWEALGALRYLRRHLGIDEADRVGMLEPFEPHGATLPDLCNGYVLARLDQRRFLFRLAVAFIPVSLVIELGAGKSQIVGVMALALVELRTFKVHAVRVVPFPLVELHPGNVGLERKLVGPVLPVPTARRVGKIGKSDRQSRHGFPLYTLDEFDAPPLALFLFLAEKARGFHGGILLRYCEVCHGDALFEFDIRESLGRADFLPGGRCPI